MERISTNRSVNPLETTKETQNLSDIVRSSKRPGGNYGSMAKSQLQTTFYICHKVESDDTLQRLALKYSINIQDIKRVNKFWSDAELGLLEYVYIPVNSIQLSKLRTIYPALNVVQNISSLTNSRRKSSITHDETISSIRSSDSSISVPTVTPTTIRNNSSFKDYFSKIDQQIQLTKKSLQSLDNKEQHSNSQSNNISTSNTSENNGGTISNRTRLKGIHHMHDNVFVSITKNSREKHISTALERIQREKDNFDEL